MVEKIDEKLGIMENAINMICYYKNGENFDQ